MYKKLFFFKCSTRSISTSRRDYGQMAVLGMFVRNQAKISLKFTDKSLFSESLSVKPGPKRLNFYGQTAIFDHFVRKRHFSSEPFTDRRPIFIDLSVNGSDFVKCSTRSISTLRRDYEQMEVLGMFVRKILLYIGSSAFSKKIKFKVWLRLLKL